MQWAKDFWFLWVGGISLFLVISASLLSWRLRSLALRKLSQQIRFTYQSEDAKLPKRIFRGDEPWEYISIHPATYQFRNVMKEKKRGYGVLLFDLTRAFRRSSDYQTVAAYRLPRGGYQISCSSRSVSIALTKAILVLPMRPAFLGVMYSGAEMSPPSFSCLSRTFSFTWAASRLARGDLYALDNYLS